MLVWEWVIVWIVWCVWYFRCRQHDCRNRIALSIRSCLFAFIAQVVQLWGLLVSSKLVKFAENLPPIAKW